MAISASFVMMCELDFGLEDRYRMEHFSLLSNYRPYFGPIKKKVKTTSAIVMGSAKKCRRNGIFTRGAKTRKCWILLNMQLDLQFVTH